MGCDSSSCLDLKEKNITPNLNIIIIEPEDNTENIKLTNQTYQKIKSIGKGSYGEVFLIKSLETQKEYALKETIITKDKYVFLYSSMNEINILSKIDNPFIVSLRCAFKNKVDEKTEKLNIIMDYVDNGDLNKLLISYRNDEKYFEENRLLNWLFQLCLALCYLKEKEIIHRDIKPSNIFLMADDTIKLGDFGISKKVQISSSNNKIFLGTPQYTAPEIITQKDHSYNADIWSLGITFLQLISLKFPFKGENNDEIFENILKRNFNSLLLNKNKTGFNDNISLKYSKNFIDLINSMISLDPEERPCIKDILRNNMIKQRMESYLKENNFDENEVINNINDINKKINEYDSINIVNLHEKERLDKVKNNKYFRKKRDFLKKLIIINNSLKTDFKTIEVE
jgi:NIMA (never in mitosis gene a)-related kinase